ncbi:Cbp1 family collagen-binding glycoprotein adhesin [Maribellus maritimus]|uniref:Cbp1 family collagen-binding glycoprotein adhesin n=1 Tax=Maribellus maritimus TaxID=2870838 RepID=UPI001EEBC314|nr:hypothetical protein [Maribellus maritimus]MCG6188774.1 hypothetical protein [Maribellus maritimus]
MKTEKNSMLKWIVIGVFAIVVVIAGIIIYNNKSHIDELSNQNADLNMTIEERDSLVNEMANTFDEIEENLTFIREKRSQLVLDQAEGKQDQKKVLVADIKLMNEMLEESSKKIDELEKQLKSSGIEIKSFRNKIAKLSESIKQQDENIQVLKTELEKRDYQIAEMDLQIEKMDSQMVVMETDLVVKADSIKNANNLIAEQDSELNKAFFASGSFDELADNGVLTKEGGFLGIGKNKTIKEDFNETYFTELDKRNTNYFPLFVKKAKIITEHPDSSFRFIEEDNLITYLEIENPEEFWKVSKYAVVETKQ